MKKNAVVWIFILVFVFAFLVSLMAIRGTFLSDEFEFIAAANRVHDTSGFGQFITSKIGGDFWRPVAYFSFFLDYRFYGLNPLGYHLTNSFLAALNCLFVALIVWLFGKLYFLAGSDENKKKKLIFIAVLSGILFAVFPNHHEVVTWLGGRPDLVATTFYLLTLVLWFYYLIKIQDWRGGERQKVFFKKISLIIALALSAGLALLAKEVSVTLIIVFTLLLLWHFIYSRKKKILINKWSLILPWFLLVLMFVLYIIFRHQVVGSWFGGYMTAGKSEFLSLSFGDLKNWLLVPINIITHLINYNYWLALKGKFPSFLAPFVSLTYYSWLIRAIYLFIFLVLVLTLIWLVRRRRLRPALLTLLPGLVFIYLVVSPVIGLLDTVNKALESTRYYYLPSAGLCVIFALWFSLFKKTRRYILTIFFVLILLVLNYMNYKPWSKASAASFSIQQAVKEKADKLTPDDWIYVVNNPDNIFGAYVFRRGLSDMFKLYQPNIKNGQVITSGRGLNGTFAPDCIFTQSNEFWLMKLEINSGLLQSFEKIKASAPPSEQIVINKATLQLHDIKNLSGDNYEITGLQPYVVLKNLSVDPQKIVGLKMTLIPTNNYSWVTQHIYWTTADQPFYQEFLRHIWRYFSVTPDNPSAQEIIIPLCRYPAFVFAGQIKDLRISLPFKTGEIFVLR